jgi:hypothetical protein
VKRAAQYRYDEKFLLDVLEVSQAQFAVRKWLIPEGEKWRAQGRELAGLLAKLIWQIRQAIKPEMSPESTDGPRVL